MRALYTASYKTDTINLMVLDEMNLAQASNIISQIFCPCWNWIRPNGI